jgi:sec-independent protein translocase protein TatB
VFEIGFSELLLVAVIGLLVLGPERLPSAVRTTSLWIGRLRRQFNEIRADIEREVGADEIRAQLRNEQIMDQLRESRQALESSARSLTAPIEDTPPPERPPAAKNEQ